MDEKMMMKVAENLIRFKKIYGDLPAGVKALGKARRAFEVATILYEDMEIWLENDPLGMGEVCLCIRGYDVIATGEREKALFVKMIEEASNFEIISRRREEVTMNLMFQNN